MKTKLITLAALLLALILSCTAALAATANATVTASKTVKITAPMNGTLLPFDLNVGDRVASGDVLFAFETVPVYAQAGGKVALAEKSVSMECDVRGMNVEEAILAVDLYLDNCIMHSLKQVQIIHGKGTGVLRSGIQAHLKKHKAVQEFRLGRYGEGEDGVTVVTLK